jgi:plasmid stabilization system protein ParE
VDSEEIKIIWTKNAVADYNKVINYLIKNWPEKVVISFKETTQSKLEVLAKYPLMGIASQKIIDVRSILLTKHNRLYYRVKNNFIEILRVFDTRQNLTKNPY